MKMQSLLIVITLLSASCARSQWMYKVTPLDGPKSGEIRYRLMPGARQAGIERAAEYCGAGSAPHIVADGKRPGPPQMVYTPRTGPMYFDTTIRSFTFVCNQKSAGELAIEKERHDAEYVKFDESNFKLLKAGE